MCRALLLATSKVSCRTGSSTPLVAETGRNDLCATATAGGRERALCHP